MSSLVFFTSNRTKLAHFRHIGRLHGFSVTGFRQRTFYASYEEPRLDDREQLLRESYQSALKQWRRSGQSEQNFFFLEDTSVRIDALSGAEEVPGLNVKFWMQDMTLPRLDSLLRESGNNRNATVRSDVVVHVPERLRDLLGIDRDFLWVHGETSGTVASQLVDGAENFLYPWLREQSFNQWFVPDGASAPIASLPVVEADFYDFRNKAFTAVLRRIGSLLSPSPANRLASRQLSFPDVAPTPPILVICGYSCAGKTTLATFLSRRFGYLHLEASDFMQASFWQRYGPSKQIEIGDFAEEALREAPWTAAEPIVDVIQKADYGSCVVTGFRSLDEVKVLREAVAPYRDVKLIFLEAEPEVRFQRAVHRARDLNLTKAKLRKRDKRERRMGLDKIKDDAACMRILNDQSIENLESRFVTNFGQDLFDARRQGELPRNLPTDLERLVLLTLNEATLHTHMTTTQIATAIRARWGTRTAKDNVSRYFNQDVHPYYEWIWSRGKNMYTISTTGASMAMALSRRAVPPSGPDQNSGIFGPTRERKPSQLSLFET